ncbi:MAG: histidine kinase [Deltaproteobacteria bacterium]|nr:histidine kinase [Deltaproteobacteria bacterium]
MRDDELSAKDRERMRAERDALKAELSQRVEQVENLSRELAETNSGVVALYAELDDKAEQLREASELKSRFLSYMSHEFRTPLGSIRSLTRILLDRLDGPLTPEQEKQIGFIQSSAQELSEMVNDLLDLAKIEAGRISISPAWFELVDLFAALRGMFKPILHNPQVVLVFEEPVGIPRAFSDDRKIGQILRNFISNALKFTRRGEVRVSAESHDPGWVKFAVADTGIGIAPEHLDALFRDFVQVESKIHRRVQGVGLGLALSKRLAELLGGSVGVVSELGRGSIFHATLPIHFTPDEAPQTAPRARLKDA